MATKREILRHYESAKRGEYPDIKRRPDRKTPTWTVRWHGADGTRPRKDFSDVDDFAAFVAAYNFLAEVNRAKDAGTYVNPSRGRQRAGEFFRSWIEAADLKPSTKASYRGQWDRNIAPTFDARRLATINRPALKAWIADLREAGLGPRSIQLSHAVLRRVLAEAVRDGILTANPAVGVATPRRQRRAMRPLSSDEVARLADKVPARDRALVLTLAYAGIRIGEASFLRVRHVDLLHSRLHIAGSATEVRGHRIEGSTKTGAERSIALPRFLRDELTRHLAQYTDGSDPDAYVFARSGGQPLRASTWRPRSFTTAQKAAGISPRRTVHDLRHTAASLAIAAGAHPAQIKEMLGHSTIAVTIDVYGHAFPSLHEQLAARLDEAFRATPRREPATVSEIGGRV